MKRLKLNPITLTCILGILFFRSSLCAAGPTDIAAQVNTENMRKTVSALSSIPSRVNGYDEGKPGDLPRSTQWVKAQFVALGLQKVHEEPFDVTTPIDKKSQLFLTGSKTPIALRSIWPNLVRTNQTPPEGITGELIYAGKGDLRAYNGKKVLGSIVVLDFDCGSAWFNAPMLGARAVIFIATPTILRGEAESKYLSAPVNIPRFYVDQVTGAQLKSFAGSGKATIKCDMRWEKRTAYNLVGEIPGSDAKLSKEWIILEAYYDSMSVVPSLAPGAETTCGLAAMLESVRILKGLKPKRSILVVATSGHFEGLSGIRAFFNKRLPVGAKKSQQKHFERYKAFLAFELTSQGDTFGTFYKAHMVDQPENQLQWKFADIGTLLRESAQKIAPKLGLTEDNYVDGINPIKGKNWRTFLPTRLGTDNEIANLVAKPGLAFVTANDARIWVNTPKDTIDHVNFANLTKQVRLATCLLPVLINSKEKDLFNVKLDNGFYQVRGLLAEFDPKKSFIPDQPVGGSIAVMHTVPAGPKIFTGVHGIFYDVTPTEGKDKEGKDRTGRFLFSGMPSAGTKGVQWRIDGFEMDPKTGDLIKAPDRGTNGEEAYPAQLATDVADKQATMVIFECKSMVLYDMIDQRQFSLLQKLNIYDAQTEALPFSYGFSLPELPPMTSIYEPVAMVYAEPKTNIKVTMGADVLGLQFVLVNSQPGAYLGTGLKIDDNPSVPFTPYYVAEDMWKLDDHRITNLKNHGIENNRVNKLHGLARELLTAARRSLDEKRYDSFLSNVRAAWSFESRAYPDVQKTANDVVKGIMFYLFLLLPFAFFAERLFCAFPDIRKQIVGASVIFIAVFLIIRAVHPAFSITSAPLIILLAFIILALTGVVSSIITQKFEEEMRKMKMETGAIHAADVGRLSATTAAFNLGIANMRRRKARTTLTCVTLILLTFTVLSFTSVVTGTRINKLRLKYKASYNGIMIRERSWASLGEPMARIVKNELGGEFPVAPRSWYLSALVGDRSFVTVTYGSKSYAANALVGLSPNEIHVSKVASKLLGRWFKEGEMLSCVVPSGMAKQLGLTTADIGKAKLEALGAELQVIGILPSGEIKDDKDLDGEPITPVDYAMMQQERRQQSGQQQVTAGELEEYIHMTPDAALFVPYEFAILHGGDLKSVAVSFPTGKAVQEKLKSLMERIELNMYAGADGKTYLCSALGQTKPVGLSDLLVPILIVALIVLNTMLGSVFERTSEIGIFGSLGLAPVHISALFIAEACVYAVLGAISGYVIGQVLSKVLVETQMAQGLNLNYSSLSTVGSTFIVMATVLLSTLYPAKKASEMSVPDVQRRWKLPSPEGDYLKVGLPFTVSGSQSLGINMFLKQFFEAHTDYSVGNFSTADVKLAPFEVERGPAYRLEVMLWLAPYDLGVSEHMTLETVPTEDEWVNEVLITIRRESGDESSWLRVTRNFLNNLRKQFLIWRTCTPEVKAQFQRRGEEEIMASGVVAEDQA